MPDVWLLVPGYGAQGGTAADVKVAYRNDGLGAIVNSSRGITFPFHPDDPDWESKIVQAAKKAQGGLGPYRRPAGVGGGFFVCPRRLTPAVRPIQWSVLVFLLRRVFG